MSQPQLLDTHLHLLEPERFSYDWAKDFPVFSGKTFAVESYAGLAGGEVGGALFMEADVAPSQMVSEAQRYLALAEDPASILEGVIAACRPEAPGFLAHVEKIAHPKLKGFRRVLHTQPDALSQDRLFRENLDSLGREGYPFDLCVLAWQLPLAAELASACEGTVFVLDHCGASGIGSDPESFENWKSEMGKLARLQNVVCKISGIIAYFGDQPSIDSLRPFVEVCAELFGPDRIVWGSDYPVCNLGADVATWIRFIHELFGNESSESRRRFFSENAARVYNL